jgi:CubicO group peptidase (beta-lactamase class C family)
MNLISFSLRIAAIILFLLAGFTSEFGRNSVSAVVAVRSDLPAVGLLEMPDPTSDKPSGSNLDIGSLDAFIEAQMRQNRIPGMAVAITQGDRILYLQGYGKAAGNQAVTPTTPFYIGSVTKSFTALAVLQLVEEGKLDLDAPVQAYIPWFSLADETHASAITVRQLLNQTSGMARGDHNRDALAPAATIEEGVRNLKHVQPSQPPGTAFQYFNANYTILGLLVQQVSGLAYDTYLQERIFEPLEMKRSFTDPKAAGSLELAQGHTQMLGFPFPRQQPHLAFDIPAGFIISTAQDMAHYLIAQGNEGRFEEHQILTPYWMAVMHQPVNEINSSYAMGWESSAIDGTRTIQHSGSLETFYAKAILLPEQEYGLAILINQNGLVNLLTYERLSDDLVRLLLGNEPLGGISVSLIYLGIAAGIAADLTRHLYAFIRIRRWPAWAQDKSGTRQSMDIAWNLVVPIFLLVVLPLLSIALNGLAFTRVLIFYYLPDISLWILVGALLAFVRGIVKVRMYQKMKMKGWD